MYTLERLETALLARWGREEMTVYADYLQSIGDPRGEVIAIDLVNLDTVEEVAWRERRHTVISAWLGEALADKLGGMIFQGFVQEAGSDETLLSSPAGDFVRASRLGHDLPLIQRLVARPRRWLTRLAITAHAGAPNTRGPAMIDDQLAEQLAGALPRLDELVLRGSGIMKRFSHPDVRQVRIDGPALGALCWRGDWMTPPPSLALDRVREQSASADTRLYLSPTADCMAALAEPAMQRHVTHLRTPSTGAALDRALDALPRLAVVETTVTGKHFDVLHALIAKRHRRVSVVWVDR